MTGARVLLILLAALAAACASPRAPLPPPVSPAGEEPARWAAEVTALRAKPRPAAPPVVFLGSSSIRLWQTLADDMAPLPVVNAGFGGSRLFDAVFWCDTLLEDVTPRAVVVFSGTNDLAGDAPREPAWLAARFDELVARVRAHTDAPMIYLAITPTPARERHLARVHEANRLIAARCAAHRDVHFLDTAGGFLDAAGRPDPRWFVADGLHLAPEGYAQWTRAVRQALAGLLDEFDA